MARRRSPAAGLLPGAAAAPTAQSSEPKQSGYPGDLSRWHRGSLGSAALLSVRWYSGRWIHVGARRGVSPMPAPASWLGSCRQGHGEAAGPELGSVGSQSCWEKPLSVKITLQLLAGLLRSPGGRETAPQRCD